MFFIPGEFISLLTFPGVIVHEIAHRFFCDITGTLVYHVSYFRFGNPSGFVIHRPVTSLTKTFLISVGPLIINSVLCAVLAFPAISLYWFLDSQTYPWIFYILGWIGISCGVHAFPSEGDLNCIEKSLEQTNKDSLLYMVVAIIVSLLTGANALRIIWFDFIYAMFLGLIIPLIIMSFMPNYDVPQLKKTTNIIFENNNFKFSKE